MIKHLPVKQKGLVLSLSKGFTLIELLVVIGILAVLLAITLIAINPARQFSQANNTKRSSDVNSILNAVHQYAADNKGVITALNIGTSTTPVSDGVGGVGDGFCTALVTEYIAALPADPTVGGGAQILDTACTAGAWDTGYTIVRGTDNRITVSAPSTEIPPATAVISVTR